MSFIRSQLCYLFETLRFRRTARHKLFVFVEAALLFVKYMKLSAAVRWHTSRHRDQAECTVILLSHNRPQNMDLIVRSALRNAFVKRIVVSNSNPAVEIRQWVSLTDSRIQLIDETSPSQPGHRLVLARKYGGKYVLAIDDDIFLSPWQWQRLLASVIRDETVPHGLTGHMYRPGTRSSNNSPFHHVTAREQDVDVLIGAYAFTQEHLTTVFAIAGIIGVKDVSLVRNYDDILLSFAGKGRPRIHAITPAFFCASTSLPGVALWKSDDQFWCERERMFQEIRAARLTLDLPWVAEPRITTGAPP